MTDNHVSINQHYGRPARTLVAIQRDMMETTKAEHIRNVYGLFYV